MGSKWKGEKKEGEKEIRTYTIHSYPDLNYATFNTFRLEFLSCIMYPWKMTTCTVPALHIFFFASLGDEQWIIIVLAIFLCKCSGIKDQAKINSCNGEMPSLVLLTWQSHALRICFHYMDLLPPFLFLVQQLCYVTTALPWTNAMILVLNILFAGVQDTDLPSAQIQECRHIFALFQLGLIFNNQKANCFEMEDILQIFLVVKV